MWISYSSASPRRARRDQHLSRSSKGWDQSTWRRPRKKRKQEEQGERTRYAIKRSWDPCSGSPPSLAPTLPLPHPGSLDTPAVLPQVISRLLSEESITSEAPAT